MGGFKLLGGRGGEARALDKLRYDGGWSIKGKEHHMLWNATVKAPEFPDFLGDTDAREQNSDTWEFGKGALSANVRKDMFTGCCPYPWSEH
jgi:hypothetical protein